MNLHVFRAATKYTDTLVWKSQHQLSFIEEVQVNINRAVRENRCHPLASLRLSGFLSFIAKMLGRKGARYNAFTEKHKKTKINLSLETNQLGLVIQQLKPGCNDPFWNCGNNCVLFRVVSSRAVCCMLNPLVALQSNGDKGMSWHLTTMSSSTFFLIHKMSRRSLQSKFPQHIHFS